MVLLLRLRLSLLIWVSFVLLVTFVFVFVLVFGFVCFVQVHGSLVCLLVWMLVCAACFCWVVLVIAYCVFTLGLLTGGWLIVLWYYCGLII